MVLLTWVLVLVIVGGLYHAAGSNTSNNLDLPGTDSQAATDLLADQLPAAAERQEPDRLPGPRGQGKVTDSANKQAIEQSYKNMKALPHYYSAINPFSQEGQAQISKDKQDRLHRRAA